MDSNPQLILLSRTSLGLRHGKRDRALGTHTTKSTKMLANHPLPMAEDMDEPDGDVGPMPMPAGSTDVTKKKIMRTISSTSL